MKVIFFIISIFFCFSTIEAQVLAWSTTTRGIIYNYKDGTSSDLIYQPHLHKRMLITMDMSSSTIKLHGDKQEVFNVIEEESNRRNELGTYFNFNCNTYNRNNEAEYYRVSLFIPDDATNPFMIFITSFSKKSETIIYMMDMLRE